MDAGKRLSISADRPGVRLDLFICQSCEGLSRSLVQKLIDDGHVLINGELGKPSRKVKAGEECAVVESVKAASDIYAPIAGEVIARNDAALDAPESVNQDAYAAWLFKLKPADVAQLNALLDAAAYTKVAEEA